VRTLWASAWHHPVVTDKKENTFTPVLPYRPSFNSLAVNFKNIVVYHRKIRVKKYID